MQLLALTPCQTSDEQRNAIFDCRTGFCKKEKMSTDTLIGGMQTVAMQECRAEFRKKNQSCRHFRLFRLIRVPTQEP